jgi:hypothetical protein
MMQIEISPSVRPGKKFQAVINNTKTIHFGSKGASDFTLHKNNERKQKYEDRHRKREDWSDPKTAGFYAKNILWNKPTVQGSIKDTNQRFKSLRISYKSRSEDRKGGQLTTVPKAHACKAKS